jgi:CheY-like chemotaxis protein
MTNDTLPTVILVTEDEALVRMFAAEVLEEEGGFKVLEAANADEALTILHIRRDVRVLCTDVDMPGSMDGAALARLVDMKWPGIGVIVTSGRTLPRKGDLPSKASFLVKPYTPATLLDTVRNVIDGGKRIVLVTRSSDAPVAETAPVLPSAIKINPPDTGIGLDGGLAQPLQEPEK